MRQGVAQRVSQYRPPGDYGFEAGYKLGWDAAIKWMKGNEMPVPEGAITTSEVLRNLDPKEFLVDEEQCPCFTNGSCPTDSEHLMKEEPDVNKV